MVLNSRSTVVSLRKNVAVDCIGDQLDLGRDRLGLDVVLPEAAYRRQQSLVAFVVALGRDHVVAAEVLGLLVVLGPVTSCGDLDAPSGAAGLVRYDQAVFDQRIDQTAGDVVRPTNDPTKLTNRRAIVATVSSFAEILVDLFAAVQVDGLRRRHGAHHQDGF